MTSSSFFQSERVEYDAVQYFSDAGLGGGDDVVMTDDQQKLIKVWLEITDNNHLEFQ